MKMKAKKAATPNREAWLRAVYTEIRRTLLPEAPETVAVTWGFPAHGATRTRNRAIGECWTGGAVGCEGAQAILISPVITDGLRVADVLVHEMVHAALPSGTGHQGAFVRLMKRVGLTGRPTATTASPELKAKLQAIIQRVGPWPKGHLTPPAPKDKSRQLKAICDCSRILRVSRRTFEGGAILCGECDSAFMLEG
jgi:hypothetical protein